MQTFSSLEKKHKGFSNPQFKIEVDGRELKREKFPIIDLTVIISAGFEMNSCEFTLAGLFNQEKRQFDEDFYSRFKPGKLIDVKIGYTSLVGVFKGYINSLSFDFNGMSGPIVTVQCLDAKGALVNNRRMKNYGKMDYNAIVKTILEEQCRMFASISEVESEFDEGEEAELDESPEIQDDCDDYNYIMGIAEKTNNSFCVLYDEIYFGESLANKAVTKVGLAWGEGLISFFVEIDISKQIGSVEVYGTDPIRHKNIKAKQNKVSASGETGADMAKVVKNKRYEFSDPAVTTPKQAAALAKHKLESHAAQLVNCQGSTVGLPELVAGDNLKISGMGKGVDGVYFLKQVTHKFSSQGYITMFQGSSSSVKL